MTVDSESGNPRTDLSLPFYSSVLEGIARGDSLDVLLDGLCDLIESTVPDSVCSVMMLDHDTGRLSFRRSPCVPREVVDRFNGLIPAEYAGNCGRAVFTQEIAIAEDTKTSPQWRDFQDIVEEHGLRACWSVPIRVGDDVLGSFAISRTVPGAPDAAQEEMLVSSGCLAGIALQSARARQQHDRDQSLIRGLVESAADPIFAKDLDGRYLLANRAEVRGVVDLPDQMVGLRDEDLYPRDLCERSRRADRLVAESGKAHTYEEVFDNAELGSRTYAIKKTPLRDEAGTIIGIVGVARDVTEQRRAVAAMLQAQKFESLGLLAGGIAHDFNNLLTGILGNADLGLHQVGAESDAGHCFTEILRSGQMAADLVRQILTYSGRSDATKCSLDMAELVLEVRQVLSRRLSSRAEIDVRVADGVPPVSADASQLRQLVMNLLTNASEALGDREGTILVSIEACGGDEIEAIPGFAAPDPSLDYLALRIADSGMGMDQETLSRIFDPFFSSKGAGRGLGLAAVRGVLRNHGGVLEVESSRGAGTRFSVFLPVEASAGLTEVPDEPTLEIPRPVGKRVMVVDDEDFVRDMAQRSLTASGYAVDLATGGRQCLQSILDGAAYDAIVMDLTMPDLDGHQLLRELRAVGSRTPVLVISGAAPSTVEEQLAGLEISGVLRKPFLAGDLILAVGGLFDATRS